MPKQSYEKMAEYIARVAKEWRAEAQKYNYDVFISFKASNDSDGSETRDAREMHKLYDLLKDKGYRVFFSPVTLITDGVGGKGSEPYIFNALDKAKALIVYGSRKEYFSSTWVQNEWQRYLRAIKSGKKEKDSLLVLYEGFNPKELPQGLRRIQGIEYGISAYPAVLSALERVFRNNEGAEQNREKELRLAEEEKRKAEQENVQKMQEMMAQLAAMQEELAKLKSTTSPAVTEINQSIKTVTKTAAKLQSTIKAARTPIIEQKNEDFVIENGVLKKYRNRFSGKKEVIIPEGVTSIDRNAFAYCHNLIHIAIPGTVKEIGEEAFNGCEKLSNITIPDSVRSIGAGAFYNCSSLIQVTIPNGVKSIERNTFYYCTSLKSVTIPDSVTSIGYSAFNACKNLTSITIPNKVKSIGPSAFLGCGLTKLFIPESVREIGINAFFGNSLWKGGVVASRYVEGIRSAFPAGVRIYIKKDNYYLR